MGPAKAKDSGPTKSQLPTLSERLVGSWVLDTYVETDVETNVENYPFGQSPIGFILYTPAGLMSAQVQTEGRSPFKGGDMTRGETEEYVAAGRTYLAYAGQYSVDEATSRVFHDVKTSLFPNWIGMRQVRLLDVYNDRLSLSFEKPVRSNGTLKSVTVTWKRVAE